MTTATKTKDPILQEHTREVRLLEANLKVKTEDPIELRFRASLIRKITADLPAMNSGLITRLYESVCEVEFAKDDVLAFRRDLQDRIGHILKLKEHRNPATR